MLRPADRIVVRKADRRMDLYRQGAVVASYRVSLGLAPSGHKQREGDFRTPEGSYRLTRRNARSDFFLAVQVSYPEPSRSRARAQERLAARRPDHGARAAERARSIPRDRYLSTDWTDGCIALSNEDMLDFWLLTDQGTPIEIRP